MKVLMLTNGAPNQVALACKLEPHVELCALVVSQNVPKKTKPHAQRARILGNRIAGRIVGRPFTRAWVELAARYRQRYPRLPAVPTIHVRNVNDDATLEALERFRPELVVVSGTNLVSKRTILACSGSKGILNLHTGVSPYVKGGPNCTNWCLAEGWFDRIGNTIMWLDAGIDTGDLLTTERTPLTGDETLSELHFKVMEHGHALYVRAVRAIVEGRDVAQTAQDSLARGRTFYTLDWNARAMLRAQANFRFRYQAHFRKNRGELEDIVTVPLPPE